MNVATDTSEFSIPNLPVYRYEGLKFTGTKVRTKLRTIGRPSEQRNSVSAISAPPNSLLSSRRDWKRPPLRRTTAPPSRMESTWGKIRDLLKKLTLLTTYQHTSGILEFWLMEMAGPWPSLRESLFSSETLFIFYRLFSMAFYAYLRNEFMDK